VLRETLSFIEFSECCRGKKAPVFWKRIGLLLHILPNGCEVFRVAYRSSITKTANMLTLGEYGPHENQMTLMAAREKHREMRRFHQMRCCSAGAQQGKPTKTAANVQ